MNENLRLPVAGFMLLVLGFGVWSMMKTGTAELPSETEGKAVAETFLQQVQSGQAAAAWESTTAEFKSAEGREAFLRVVQSEKKVFQTAEFESCQSIEQHGMKFTEYSFKSSTGRKLIVTPGFEQDGWRVTAVRIE